MWLDRVPHEPSHLWPCFETTWTWTSFKKLLETAKFSFSLTTMVITLWKLSHIIWCALVFSMTNNNLILVLYGFCSWSKMLDLRSRYLYAFLHFPKCTKSNYEYRFTLFFKNFLINLRKKKKNSRGEKGHKKLIYWQWCRLDAWPMDWPADWARYTGPIG